MDVGNVEACGRGTHTLPKFGESAGRVQVQSLSMAQENFNLPAESQETTVAFGLLPGWNRAHHTGPRTRHSEIFGAWTENVGALGRTLKSQRLFPCSRDRT